jgi:uncharacterized DUF497 family protein
MIFDWDKEKNEANILKHGVDFHDVKEIFRNVRVTGIDNRREYGEIRKVSIGPINSHICVVVYTEREDNIRIISARRANQRERRRYYEYIEKTTNEEP